ncbi:hypothetical protein B0H13DRAFT_2267169 [Mycena leptocephala]|nr:hypothetical protein B0H13DRAFT_2267169 [Mycena leptocephala]
MPHNPAIKLVVDRARYLPPVRSPSESNRLRAGHNRRDDTHPAAKNDGRLVRARESRLEENKVRCAITGEPESDDLPCGPNSAQKKVEEWLIDAGLLAPEAAEESDEPESDDHFTPSELPPLPKTPRVRPWHRRLEIVIPKAGPKSASEPALLSPRSPLSPTKLWSAVQRGTSSIPKVRLKPKFIPPTPPSPSVSPPVRRKCRSLDSAPAAGPSSASNDQSVDPYDTLLATAFKRAALLRTITDDDAHAIIRRHRNPLPRSHPDATWCIPANEPPPAPEISPITPPKPKPRSKFEDPASYRWPAPVSPPPSYARFRG